MKRSLLLILALGGCAYTTDKTAVAPVAPGVWQVGATAGHYVGGVAQARTLALQEAARFCGDKPMTALSVEPQGTRATVTFRCDAGPASAPPPVPTYNVNVNTRS